jgi:hypothetical protein
MSRRREPESAGDEGEQQTERADEVAREELLAQVELLTEENERLRESYIRAQSVRDWRSAVGMAGLGLVAILAAVAFPTARTVLLSLGATGLFGAVLIYALSPGAVITADVGTEVYRALASNHERIRSALGLADSPTYVPHGETGSSVRLFLPQSTERAVPTGQELEDVFVVGDDQRGLSLEPTGAALFDEFQRALRGEPSDTVDELLSQLAEGLTEQFEIVDAVEFTAAETQVTVEIKGKAYGSLEGFDHPVVSFVAVGLVRGLGVPVTVQSVDADDGVFVLAWDDDLR